MRVERQSDAERRVAAQLRQVSHVIITSRIITTIIIIIAYMSVSPVACSLGWADWTNGASRAYTLGSWQSVDDLVYLEPLIRT